MEEGVQVFLLGLDYWGTLGLAYVYGVLGQVRHLGNEEMVLISDLLLVKALEHVRCLGFCYFDLIRLCRANASSVRREILNGLKIIYITFIQPPWARGKQLH